GVRAATTAVALGRIARSRWRALPVQPPRLGPATPVLRGEQVYRISSACAVFAKATSTYPPPNQAIPMKKTDLEKSKALKLVGKMKHSGALGRFPADANTPVIDRREQRKLDQAQGLVSFPVKIKQTLADEIRK